MKTAPAHPAIREHTVEHRGSSATPSTLARVSGGFEILFEGQTHATTLTAEITVQTLENWSLRAREVPGAELLFDRINAWRRGETAGALQLGRVEARLLADVFEASGFEELRTLIARARAAAIDEGH